eukprot:TRINITY_DN3897_c0_g1_i1.p1 TRINITY_DN3897_c0_g1~~TRINITY_DN3897_c0_g1_i1.p1  ORF type:complete len:197 (-),score=36.47 TRINITY_DN3897_c0_g1_i1:51-641(-)
MLRFVVALVLLNVISLVHGQVVCTGPNVTNCATCTAQASCGWCQSQNAQSYCIEIVGGRPADGGCADNDDVFVPVCSDPCNQYDNCGDCMMSGMCGFCGGNNNCYGPQTNCASDWRAPGSNNCRVNRACTAETFCEDCTSNMNGCKWCGKTLGNCVSETSTGNCTAGFASTEDQCAGGDGFSDSASSISSFIAYFF